MEHDVELNFRTRLCVSHLGFQVHPHRRSFAAKKLTPRLRPKECASESWVGERVGGGASAFVGDALGVSMGVLRDLPGVRGEINNAVV